MATLSTVASATYTLTSQLVDNYPYGSPTATATASALAIFASDGDPYLDYQPAFAYTLLSQLLVAGITLTLLCVLLIQLLFTAQYHYPLAPLNFCLQLTSIVVVLLSVIIKIAIIMNHSFNNASQWPYDLDYIAVPIPPPWWTLGQDAAWFFLQALNIGMSNITHIQFLTLLFPSRTEARLIIFILGPLAIVSSGLVFTALSPTQYILDIGDAIRNTLESCLLLIFTITLFLWGFFVNRRRAWRFDGGTAIFGIGSLFMAVISTAFNFVSVKEDGIDWLQHLLYAAILWQTWLGWWWWVGSGMGIGEVEDLMQRAEKKKRKAAKRAARLRQRNKAMTPSGAESGKRHRSTSLATLAEAQVAALSGFQRSVTGILRNRSTLVHRNTSKSVSSSKMMRDVEEGIELDNLTTTENGAASDGGNMESPITRTRPAGPLRGNSDTGQDSTNRTATGRVEFSEQSSAGGGTRPGIRAHHSATSETSSTSQTPSLHAPHTIGQLLSFPTTFVQIYFRRLRHAHEDAAKQRALTRAELRAKVFSAAPEGDGIQTTGHVDSHNGPKGLSAGSKATHALKVEKGVADGDEIGWGLGKFGIREHREGARRISKADELLQNGRLLSRVDSEGSRLPNDLDEEGTGDVERGDDNNGIEESSKRDYSFGRNAEAGPSTSTYPLPRPRAIVDQDTIDTRALANLEAELDRGNEGEDVDDKLDDEWEDITNHTSSSSSIPTRSGIAAGKRTKKSKSKRKKEEENEDRTHSAPGSGWSWWGPLKDWRLNDRSQF